MIRLLILSAIIVLLIAVIKQLKNFQARDRKAEELRPIEMQGDIVDLKSKIAEKKAQQKDDTSELEGKKPRD